MIGIQTSVGRVMPVTIIALTIALTLAGCGQSESAEAKNREAAVNAYNNHPSPPPAAAPVEVAAAPAAPAAAETASADMPTATPTAAVAAPTAAPQVKGATPPPAPAPQSPASPPPAAIVRAGLPAGPGRETVQRVCTSCHAIGMVTAKGRTADGWSEIIGRMIGLGLEASDEDLQTVHAYLTRELPPR